MSSSVNENEAEMVKLSTTGDERTVEHTATLKLSIQEIACLVEDNSTDCINTHDEIDFSNINIHYDSGDSAGCSCDGHGVGQNNLPPYNLSENSDEENLIIDIVNQERNSRAVEQDNNYNTTTIPVSSDIKTKIKLLEDDIINKRRSRNRLQILLSCKNFIFYIFLLYLFLIPNMIIIFVYHDNLLAIFDNSGRVGNTNYINGTDGTVGVDGTDGRDGTVGVDGTDGRNGTDGRDGINGTLIDIQQLIANITETVTIYINNNIANILQQHDTINFRNVIIDSLVSTNITSTNNNFVRVDADHYTGTTFNNCLQGSC